MRTKASETEESIDPRTRRAATEAMTVVLLGEGTGMFDVYSGENTEPYVVDLTGETDRCTCPDVEYNLEEGERCKHIQRVRLEFGLAPFEDVPPVRDEHAAATDVELARRRRGIDVEPEPEPVTVDVGPKPQRAVVTDGGQVLEPEIPGGSGEETHADGCDNPECEGLDADGRPLLSFPCWREWS